MSGVYLLIWDKEHKDRSPVLRPTKGGYPHITVAYTGKLAPLDKLITSACHALTHLALNPVVLTKAYVNTFEVSPGKMRYDVLFETSVSDQVELLRRVLIKQVYDNWELFSMRDVHVTHGIYETKEEAQKVADLLNTDHLPYSTVVVGVTID